MTLTPEEAKPSFPKSNRILIHVLISRPRANDSSTPCSSTPCATRSRANTIGEHLETAQGEEEPLWWLCSEEGEGDTRTDEARGRRDTRARVIQRTRVTQGLTKQRHASTRLLVSTCRFLQGGTRCKQERENPSRSNAASFTSSL